MDGWRGSLAKFRRIMRAADPQFDRRLSLLLLGSILAGVAEIASIGSIIPLVAAASDGGGGFIPKPIPLAHLGADTWAMIFAILVVVTAAIRMVLSHFSQRQLLIAGHEVAVAVHARVLNQPYSYHVRHHSSALVAALEKVDMLVGGIGWPLVQALAATIVGGAILVLLATTEPMLTLSAAVLVVGLYWIFSRLFTAALDRHGVAVAAGQETRARLLLEGSAAIRDLLVGQRQSWFVDAFRENSARLVAARSNTDMLGNAPRFVIEALGAILFAFLAAAAARQSGGLAAYLPVLALFAVAFVRLLPLAHQLFRGWANLAAGRATIDDVAALFDLPIERPKGESPMAFERGISINGLTFAYPGTAPVLQDVSLDIAKGEWIALTGPTGSGKSTLGDLLVGLLVAESEAIRVDGQVIDRESAPAWQQQVAPVSQSVFIADVSIAGNIAFAESGPIDPARLNRAAEIAQLGSWTQGLTDGLETAVGEAGRRISGGERQRIGIARALYKNAPFLLLDEATNALDHDTEVALFAALRAARPDVTVVLISHREAALAACDRIYRVEGGRVAAR